MQQRRAMYCLIAATMLAWGSWLATVFSMDPTIANTVGFFVFYVTLGCAVAGSAVLLGVVVRRRAVPWERELPIAIRQGVLVGVGVVIAVILQSRALLSWINLVFLVIALTLLELFWISLRRGGSENHHAASTLHPGVPV